MNSIAWLIASLIFFSFAFLFWRFGNDPIRSFTIRKRFEEESEENGDMESKKRITAFLDDFDGYLISINERNKFRYRIAAGGFLVAGLTALLLSISIASS